MTFGNKLQLLRRQRGWTQEMLAEKLGVSRQTLSRWEQNAALPDTVNVIEMAKLFGVTTDSLLLDDREQPVHNEKPDPGTKNNPALPWLLSGGILGGLSALGLLFLGIWGSLHPADVEVFTSSGETLLHKTGFWGFLETSGLNWLFCLLILLTAAGVALLCVPRLRPRAKP